MRTDKIDANANSDGTVERLSTVTRRAATTGVITHVQRFSVHDGPGIRTTVFLKGCQMRCAWCHNPETFRPQPELQVFADRCIGCGACLDRCEHGAHQLVDDRRVFHRERCVACGRCAETCYAGALVLSGRQMTAEDVLREVLADRAFYESSGGGATVSGGEPLLQPDFTRAILGLCKEEGIHTALDTNLAVPWSRVEPILPVVDLFLVDVKIADDGEHRRWTAASNRETLANLRDLDRQGKPTMVRTPLVAGVNDRVDQIAAIAELLSPLANLIEYEMLPYHPLGSNKYESLGLAPLPAEFHAPSAEHLARLAAVAREAGLPVRAREVVGTRGMP